MSVFFTSDHHFFHANIILPNYSNRPFTSVEEMNRELIARWNSVIQPSDKVYVVGDFAFGKLENVKKIVDQLNGYKILIRGNHDRGKDQMLKSGFNEVHDQIYLDVAGQQVLLHHYPYRPSNDEIKRMNEDPGAYKLKNLNRRPENKGLFLIHGHVHDVWLQKDKMINVSVEMWDYFPASITQIEKMIQNGSQDLKLKKR
jgi:calcineurin-like phosphoesterase family protein